MNLLDDEDQPPSRLTSGLDKFRGELEHGIQEAAFAGAEVEKFGAEVSKAARVAKSVTGIFDQEYFDGKPASSSRSRSGRHSRSAEGREAKSDAKDSNEDNHDLFTTSRGPTAAITNPSVSSRRSPRDSRPNTPSPPPADSRPPSRVSSVLPLFSDKSSDKDTAPVNRSSSTKNQKFNSVDDLKAIISETRELIDKALAEFREIMFRRQQHIGPYDTNVSADGVDFKNPSDRQKWKTQARSDRQDFALGDAQALASLIVTSGQHLQKAHKGLRILDSHSPLKPGNDSLGLGAKDRGRLVDKIRKLHEGFKRAKDMVKSLARQEIQEIKGGLCEKRLRNWIKRSKTDVSRRDVARVISEAKAKAANTDLASMNLESGEAHLVLQNPFCTIIPAVSHLRTLETSSGSASEPRQLAFVDQPTSTNIFARVFSQATASKPTSSKSKTRVVALETGHKSHRTSSKSHNTTMLEAGRTSKTDLIGGEGNISDVSTDDTDLFGDGDPEKQALARWSKKHKKILYDEDGNPTTTPDGRPIGPDGRSIELGYRVPTDDPNDSESPSELVEDAKDKVVMEHIVIPLSILFWIAIFGVLIFWGVSRIIGSENPLGDVDLGSHFGNDAWNDTNDALTATATSLLISKMIPAPTLTIARR